MRQGRSRGCFRAWGWCALGSWLWLCCLFQCPRENQEWCVISSLLPQRAEMFYFWLLTVDSFFLSVFAVCIQWKCGCLQSLPPAAVPIMDFSCWNVSVYLFSWFLIYMFLYLLLSWKKLGLLWTLPSQPEPYFHLCENLMRKYRFEAKPLRSPLHLFVESERLCLCCGSHSLLNVSV